MFNKETRTKRDLKKRGLPSIHVEIPADIEKSKEKEREKEEKKEKSQKS
jgi:hypothetical protein